MKIGEFFHKLFGGRDYKTIDGTVYVKEGFGDWERLDDHLKHCHPQQYDDYIEEHRKK
jgi:hypothetical protein